MRIALDAMGSDGAPTTEIAGTLKALAELGPEVSVVLVGDEDRIQQELQRQQVTDPRVLVSHASEHISGAEAPASAVRRKPDSSIVVGVRMHAEREADAFVSAGSTGAVMAASLFHLKRLQGVDRPAIGTVVPTAAGALLLLDAGANVDCKPQHLLQFARLGNIFAQDLMACERPRIGLLNIGEEPEKGDELVIETHKLLADSELDFVGNVEGSDVVRGACDVLVCDGFVGNVLLKFYESVAGYIVALFRNEIAGTEHEQELDALFRRLDYAEYGGAPLLGVNGFSIICHGRSSSKAIANALNLAARAVDRSMVDHIRRAMADVVDLPEVTA